MIQHFLNKQKIDLSLRAENLSEDQFYSIADIMKNLNKTHFSFFDFQFFFQSG